MKFFVLMVAVCVMIHASWAGDEKQIMLEDIEQDTLIHETDRTETEHKELSQAPTQHIHLSYSKNPQDVLATPQPRYSSSHDSPADLRTQLYHLPKVHESDQTYTVPAKQTLLQPIIGGSHPIQPVLTPQPQYIYIQSPQPHQPYLPQAHAYVMVPYQQHHYQQPQQQIQVQHHHHLPQPQVPNPTPTVYTYSQAPASLPQQPSYQIQKSHEYNFASTVMPLNTHVDYKNSFHLPIVPKKTLPSIHTTSFQQYYSPGLEYHYSEAGPVTKLAPQPTYTYQHAPAAHNYQHVNYVSQAPSYSYYQTGPSATYNKHQQTGLLDSYVPSLMTYARQQQQPQPQPQPTQYKNYYPAQQQQTQQYSTSHIPQQLFTPAHPPSYSPYPSPQAYNTIQYSVPMPPYDHSKRSTSKATATASLSVKAPKTN